MRFTDALTRAIRPVAIAALILCGAASTVAAQQARRAFEPFWGVGFDETLASPSQLAAVLAKPIAGTWTHPLHIRLIVRRDEIERAPGQFDFAALDARLATYGRLPGVDVYLEIRGLPAAASDVPDWGTLVRQLAAHSVASVRGYVIGVEDVPQWRSETAAAVAFAVKTTAIEIRAARPGVSVTLAGLGRIDAAGITALYDADIAPYVDAVAVSSPAEVDRLAPIVDRRDPTSAIVMLGTALDDAGSAAQQFVRQQLEYLGTRVTGVTYAAPPAAVAATLPAIAFLRDLIDQPLSTLDETAAGLALTHPASPNTSVRHRLLFGLTSAANYLVYFSDGQTADLWDLSIIDASGNRPVVRDPVRQSRAPVDGFAFDAPARRETMRVPAAAWPLVVDWSAGDTPAHVERSEASTAALPSIAEIIARHQQAQTAQDNLIATAIADATIAHHFRPNAADPGYDVVTENRYFIDGRQTEFVQLTFQFNGSRKFGADSPGFPLLQPEKVLSLPLDLRLSSDYRYAFDGNGLDVIDGRACFALTFEPVRPGASLYRGTVWIDRETYLKAKVTAVQTGLAPPILSSTETQRFDKAGTVNGHDVYLMTDLLVRQDMLIAGRSIPYERRFAFRNFRLNAADFEAERQAARLSPNIMFRDTDRGLRHLVLKDGQRVVDENPTRTAKALLLGVNVDPSFDFPLPLGGLNYLNFQFLGPDSQAAVLFAGVLALINVQRPNLIGHHVDGSLDLFAIAVPSSDRTYDEQGERPAERVRTIPFTTGVNLGWRVTTRTRLLFNYEFRYDWYGREPVTAPEFHVPTPTATNGVDFGAEWRRSGYALAAHWSTHARVHWDVWGDPAAFDQSQQEYERHSLSLTKDVFSGIQKLHLNAAYYGGHNLDRFSQYQFGFFDEDKIHGVPSSGVRFSDLGMFRATYAVNLLDQYRLELSLDHAYGRDPLISNQWQPITGIGVGFLLRGPGQWMIRGDVGKSFLPDRYKKPGSLVLQFQFLKPL